MKTSDSGRDFIKSFEGWSATPYLCTGSVPTIGWGTTKGITMNTPAITKEEGDRLFDRDLIQFENAVMDLVEVPLNQNQFDALVSFTYNCGISALQKSTLLKKLNAGDYGGVSVEFAKWNKSGGKITKGLVRRRTAERELWLKK